MVANDPLKVTGGTLAVAATTVQFSASLMLAGMAPGATLSSGLAVNLATLTLSSTATFLGTQTVGGTGTLTLAGSTGVLLPQGNVAQPPSAVFECEFEVGDHLPHQRVVIVPIDCQHAAAPNLAQLCGNAIAVAPLERRLPHLECADAKPDEPHRSGASLRDAPRVPVGARPVLDYGGGRHVEL